MICFKVQLENTKTEKQANKIQCNTAATRNLIKKNISFGSNYCLKANIGFKNIDKTFSSDKTDLIKISCIFRKAV